jgi:PKD repeat protein
VQDNSSSQGPASDGRIKPDISANGWNQLSTAPNNTTQVGGGTSAACPGVAGITLQLIQAYKELNAATDAPTSLIKAAMLNSAEDIGNPGPDYRFGWGRVNAYRAVKVLEDVTYFNATIAQGGTNTHTITVPAGAKQIRMMVYWHDQGGNPLAAVSLINDLDMTVTDPATANWNPWILDPTPVVANLTANATRGADHLNNMEQVTLDNPAAGTYTVTVNGFAVPQGPQEYYLVYEIRGNDIAVTYPSGGEGFVPGEQEVIRWDAVKGQGNFTLEYSTDNGVVWNNISTTVNQNTLQYTWTVPNAPTGEALIRVSQGAINGTHPSVFSIIGVPQNIAVDWVCVDSIRLTWNAVPNAAWYEISRLGTTYMDSVGTSLTNSFILGGTSPTQDYWFSVRAVMPNGSKGRRALAIFRDGTGLVNCPLAVDAENSVILSPGTGTLQDCQNLSASSVTIQIENPGVGTLSNIPVAYSINGGTPVTDVYTGTLNSFATASFTFPGTVNLATAGVYNIKSWVDYVGDLNNTNDTATATVTVIAGTTETLPYVEDFEAYALCGTANDCEATICPFGAWINEANLDQDDIDFRISEGGTPSVDTGPDADHTLGTTGGNYAYTEASACFGKAVNLVSPCIDLAGSTSPVMSFWYHMYGADMGTLHIDVYNNGTWTNDIMPAISGDQGNQWLQASVNLTAYVGNVVNFRFRGLTGVGFTSDIAIDDINIYETSAPPTAVFTTNANASCIGGVVQLTDMSTNNPTSWNWTFTPNTVTFVNGTSATSQNPQVQLNAAGTYDVTLTATNSFGNGSATQTAYISATAASLPPVVEDFQAAFPPAGWNIVSSNATYQWAPSALITGASGNPTTAAYFNNFNYNTNSAYDELRTMEIDLTGATSAKTTFDVAYARYSVTDSDTLLIAVSNDCGSTFANTVYYKGGTDLATVPDQTAIWQPTASTEWRNDTVDLASYIGQKIIVAFININGFGNSLFLDNINIDITTGINDVKSNVADVKVTPNPSSGVFKLDIANAIKGNFEYSIVDMGGKEIMSKQLNIGGSHSEIIDLSKHAKGSYQLHLKSAAGTKHIKLVVM